mmetsp:Transcript_53126/g.139334  ORF Transcript_53126/g.139334 Transcript_53126/m.139334 type:complete len:145 (-) Transcript_53126:13-447(-)
MKRIRGAFGDRLGVTLAHCSTALGYLLWGSASSARGMIACLFPMALGSGASPMLLARFQERTKELQLEQGEASGVHSAVGAVGRMIAPQLFLRLWLWAAASRSGGGGGQKAGSVALRPPIGAPMFSVALLSLVQEAFHQASWSV